MAVVALLGAILSGVRALQQQPRQKRQTDDEEEEEEAWIRFYHKLQSHKNSTGTFMVDPATDVHLASWVVDQYKKLNEGTLKAYRKSFLQSIGLFNNTSNSNSNNEHEHEHECKCSHDEDDDDKVCSAQVVETLTATRTIQQPQQGGTAASRSVSKAGRKFKSLEISVTECQLNVIQKIHPSPILIHIQTIRSSRKPKITLSKP